MNQLSFYLGGLRASGKDQRTAKRQQKAGGVLADYGVELREAKAGGKASTGKGERLDFLRRALGQEKADALIVHLSESGVTLEGLFPAHPDLDAVLAAYQPEGEKAAPTLEEARAAQARLREAVLAGAKAAREEARPQSKRQGDVLAESIAAHLRPYLNGIEWRNN